MQAFTTGFVFDEHFLQHDTGLQTATVSLSDGVSFEVDATPHASSLSITKRTKQFFDGSGLTAKMRSVSGRPASMDELMAYHTREYIEGIKACAQGGPVKGSWGEVKDETVVSPGSFEAALYAAGGAINAVSAVLDGDVNNAYALLRPPGHHATRNQALGFCIFNNAVIAAHYAREAYGLDRIMIVDWDVHHGNGTQDAFYHDKNVLFVSLHQQNWYPRFSGELEQVGDGATSGYTVNIPLPAGTGDKGYVAAFEQIVVPVGLQFQPQLIIISAGQDACWLDPLAQMMVTMAGFRRMSQLMVDLARQVCQGRLVMLQEGGYSLDYIPYCTIAAVEPLLGINSGMIDPDKGTSELECCMEIFTQETQNALIRARNWHKNWWRI